MKQFVLEISFKCIFPTKAKKKKKTFFSGVKKRCQICWRKNLGYYFFCQGLTFFPILYFFCIRLLKKLWSGKYLWMKLQWKCFEHSFMSKTYFCDSNPYLYYFRGCDIWYIFWDSQDFKTMSIFFDVNNKILSIFLSRSHFFTLVGKIFVDETSMKMFWALLHV